jgi:hypothetical protein
MREAPPEDDLCWRELAIVAKALADGRDVTEIGLMHDIALRTIAVLGDRANVGGGGSPPDRADHDIPNGPRVARFSR